MTVKQSGSSEKKKIAILGSGISALATAFELTDYEGWENHYDITIYQMGWRLGGKTASSRGVHGRIEERGIHIFQGWYENAFRIVKEAYAEREEKGLAPDNPLKTWRDALVQDDATLITEWNPTLGKWTSVPMVFPNNDEIPGTSGHPSIADLINKAVGLVLELIIGSPYEKDDDGHSWWPEWLKKHFFDDPNANGHLGEQLKSHSWWEDLKEKVEKEFEHISGTATHRMMAWAKKEADRLLEQASTNMEEWHSVYSKILVVLEKIFGWLEKGLDHQLDRHPRANLLVCLIEFVIINLKGVLEDVYDPKTHQFEFSRINKYDYRDWLKKHGASERVLACGIVKFMYYGSFANQVDFHQGRLAADIAVRMTLLSVDYKEAFVWKFTAGTGDSLIAPIYQVLKGRGVKFEFFHKVSNVVPGQNGAIEQIEMERQVDLKEGVTAYDPLIQMPNGVDAWPDQPLYDQLNPKQAKELQKKSINLESNWADWKPVGKVTLHQGDDFDHVVLGIPVTALKDICQPILKENEQWRQMVEKVRTTQTFGVQLWFKPDQAEMGFDVGEWGIEKGTEPNTVIYSNPMYSWTAMSLVLDQEFWPEAIQPGQLSYYCGTMEDATQVPPYSDHDFPAKQHQRVIEMSKQWVLDYMGWFFPKATSSTYPQGLDLHLLVNPQKDAQDANPDEKYENQFFVANIDPTDRYTLAIPGTDQYRLKPGDSGYENLYLCGDWTDFGLNVGHMEGAVTSGLKAAQALRTDMGFKNHKEIFE